MRKAYLLLALALFFFHFGKAQVNDSINIKSNEEYLNELFAKGAVGKDFPAFQATGLDGKSYNNENFKGKVTFINFWFTGCHPCLEEVPDLNRLYNMYKDSSRVQFYAITYDKKELAEATAREHGMQYPVVLVPPGTARVINLGNGYPTSLVVNGKGQVSYIRAGGIVAGQKVVEYSFHPALQKALKSL